MDAERETQAQGAKIRREIADVPGMQYYLQLVWMEQRVMESLACKQLQIQQASFKAPTRKKVARVQLSSTVDRSEGTWTLFVEGRTVESEAPVPLTRLFRVVVAEITTDGHTETLEWTEAKTTQHSNTLAIKRKGKQPEIRLLLQKKEDVFVVAEQLAAVIGLERGTRPQILYALWKYIKVNRLPDNPQTKCIVLDTSLRAVFGAEELRLAHLSQAVLAFTRPQDPLEIRYCISQTHGAETEPAFYECEIECRSMQKRPLVGISSCSIKEIVEANAKIAVLLKQLEELNATYRRCESFAESPVAAMLAWIDEQARDITEQMEDVDASTDRLFSNAALLKEQVRRYLART